jgi:tetratricopeptide (TPR) repeat protein
MIAAVLSLWLAFQVTPELKHHVEAGLAAKRAGQFDIAIREFRRVVELAPGLAAAHVNLGAVYCDNKDYEKAIPPLRKALEIDQNLPGAHEMLGLALLAQGYAAESVPHLEKARSDALLGVAFLESGRVRDAVDKLESALQKQPGDADLLYYLGQAHAQLSKQVFEVLSKKNPDSPRTHQLLGEAAVAAGNREAAEKHLGAALELRSDLRGVHFALGELYVASGNYERAEQEFRQESRLNPGSAATAYKLGVVLMNRGDVQAAVTELKRADALQPGMPEALLELGKANAATGDLASAEKLLRQVLEQEDASTLAEAAHFHLSQIYRKLGRATDADREMKRFQEIRRVKR